MNNIPQYPPDTRYTALTPPLTDAEYQALKASILEHGRVLVEVIHDEHGITIDGFHRERAVAELRAEGHKIPDPEVKVYVGLSDTRKRTIARQVNIARRHMNTQQKQQMIHDQLRETPGASNNAIANDLQVDHKTVAAARKRLEEHGELEPQERTVGADGKSRPAKRPASKTDNKRGTCRVCELDVTLDQDWAQDGDVIWHTACVNPDGADDDYEPCDWDDEEGDDDEAAEPEDDAPAPAVDSIGWCDVCGDDVLASHEHCTVDGEMVHAECWCILQSREEAAAAPAPAPPAKPLEVIRVDNVRQAEKLKDLAEAGRLGDVMSKGINAAHKQLREQRRHEEIREHAAAASVDGERLRVECMDALEFLRSLPTCSVDMIWTDPPYYIASRGGGTKVGDSYATFDAGGEGWDDDQWDDESDFLFWLNLVALECNRVLKPTGNIVMCMDRALVSHLWDRCRIPEVYPHGLSPKNVLAWHKTNAAPNARGNFDSSLELAVWAAATDYHFKRPATGQCSSVWSGPFVSGPARERWPHPTAKPVAWIQSHLEVLSTPGQLVVDPFGGSGATVEASLRLGRRVIANDRSEKFASMCRARGAAVLEELEGEKLEGGRGWEEAIPCAGCRQPINGTNTVDTREGRMHEYPCGSTWHEREEAAYECDLCGKQHTANDGGVGSYGSCCSECSLLAYRAGMKATRQIDVVCPTCGAAVGKRCKAGRTTVDTHDARVEAARKLQQAAFADLAAEVPSR